MKNYLLKGTVGVCVAALIACGFAGVFEPLGMSPTQQVALVTLLIAALLWMSEAVPLFVTSFVILTLNLVWLQPTFPQPTAPEQQSNQAETGNQPTIPTDSPNSSQLKTPPEPEKFLSPFFSDIILLFLGGFVLSAALNKYQFDEQIAQWILAQTGGSIPKLLIGIMGITAVLSMFLSNTATTAMMLTLCLPIVNSLPQGDAYRKAILLSVPFAANLGGLGTPVGSPPNAIAIQYLGQGSVSFGAWMVLGIPGVVGMLGILWCVLMLLYRGETGQVTLEHSKQKPERTMGAYLVLAIAGLTVLAWVSNAWHGMSSGTVALLPILVFFGAGILSVKDLRSLSWDVLLVMGGGLSLGVAISESELSDWMVAQLPLEGTGDYALLVLLAVVGCVMSSLMSNTATANLLMPVIVGMSLPNETPFFIGIAFACSLAMPLPISTPPNAIAFASGELSVKDMLLPGLILTAVGIFLTFTVGYWWWDLVGLF